MRVCPSCGESNPERARFCLACGTELDDPGEQHEERKVVSVLFVDLVGFTAQSGEADPEDVRSTLRPYHARVKAEIERFGGTVEKFIGDAVMAVFGAPVAREDDAERAVRAGLRVLEATDELSLEVRAAVNTGEAVVTLTARPDHGEALVAGDVVNTASRLQTAAAPGTLVVGELTYRTTHDRIAYEELEPVSLKGKAGPVPLWRVVGARSRLGVDAELGAASPFVGRDHELALLEETYARVEREDDVQLVTLVGEPGVGKTRLVRELGRRLDEQPQLVYWRQGRCLPYGEGISFWAVGEIVKAHAGVLETDSPDAAAERLAAAVSAVVPDPAEQEWMTARLAPLLGVAGDATAATREESFSAWRQFLEALAADRPLVLLFEDVHWADPPLLEFVEHLVDWALGVPLLVLCTTRPELYERHPAWGGGKRNSTTLSLSPLSGEETARLLAALLSEAVLPAETQTLLLDRCGGNPLYAEQFVRMLSDRGVLERRGRAVRVTSTRDVPVPETVQALIAARLDTLGAERKSLLQDAAVVGKVFWDGSVAAIGGRDRHDVAGVLVDLAHKDFVRPARGSSFEAQREFAFTHALVRDVAYRQLPRAERARKHRLAAEWIEAAVGERIEDHAQLLAFHYEEALALARAAGAGPDELEQLRAAAVRYLGLAGETAYLDAARGAELLGRALELAVPEERPALLAAAGWIDVGRGLFEQGAAKLEEAVDGLRGGGGDVRRLGLALTRLGRARWSLGRPDSLELRHEAIALLEAEPPGKELALALAGLAGEHMMAEDAAACLAVCERGLPIARATGAVDAEIGLLQYAGTSRVATGDIGGIDDCRSALRQAIQVGHAWDAIVSYVNTAYWTWWLDGPAAGAAVFRECGDFAERRGLPGMRHWADAELVWTLFELGEWDEVADHARRIGADSEVFGTPTGAMALPSLARVLLERGAVAEARAVVDPLVPRVVAGLILPQVVVPTYTVAAAAALAGGDRERALRLLEELELVTQGRFRSRAIELAEVARVGVAAGDASVAAQILADPYPPVPRAEHQHVSAEAVLAEAAGETARALALYRDAAGRWERFPHLLERAHALLGAGRCADALERGAGAAETEAARALFAELGASLRLRDLPAAGQAAG